jgi:hypothetical protein
MRKPKAVKKPPTVEDELLRFVKVKKAPRNPAYFAVLSKGINALSMRDWEQLSDATQAFCNSVIYTTDEIYGILDDLKQRLASRKRIHPKQTKA